MAALGQEAAASVLTSLNIFRPLQLVCSFERPLKITLLVLTYWVPALGPALCLLLDVFWLSVSQPKYLEHTVPVFPISQMRTTEVYGVS